MGDPTEADVLRGSGTALQDGRGVIEPVRDDYRCLRIKRLQGAQCKEGRKCFGRRRRYFADRSSMMGNTSRRTPARGISPTETGEFGKEAGICILTGGGEGGDGYLEKCMASDYGESSAKDPTQS